MAVTIHPHKGYLNTEFHIHQKGDKQLSYEVYTKNSSLELYSFGIVKPFIPQSIKISIPGKYEVLFNDGTLIDLVVEDAYKFGGSTFKRAFVFDKCVWVFVVMYDRTYFHNRETGEEYVEPISPDEIIEVSKEYVLFKTAQQKELTLYSLKEQKPIREFYDIVTHNERYIIYEEEITDNDEHLYINIYSLKKNKCILKQKINRYDIYEDDLYLFKDYSIENISLKNELIRRPIPRKYKGKLIKIIDASIAITYSVQGSDRNLYVYSLTEETILKKIPVEGHLCAVNGETVVNLYSRISAINRFDILKTEFPEASVQVQYDEYVFYNCGWEIFYEVKSSRIFKEGCREANKNETRKFCSCNLCIPVNHDVSNGSIYRHENTMLISTDSICELYSNIEANKNLRSGLYDFSQFEKLGILKNIETNEKFVLSKELLSNYARYVHYESIGEISLQSMGYRYVSPKNQYAIENEGGKVFLIKRNFRDILVTTRILQDLFDSSIFNNVLLSEDGSKVMHRNGNGTIVVDVKTGETQLFKNLFYVQHINGIRTTFEIDKKRQVVLINPVTGQFIPSTLLSKHSFISPDGSMYADTNIDAYIEYYNLIEKRVISKSEYDSILNRYSYSFQFCEKDRKNNKVIEEAREQFVRANLSWFKKCVRNVKSKSNEEWVKFFVDENNVFGNEYFISFIVEKRGIAVIKKVKDDSEVARIKLGRPLWFLNYVSFSYDGRYVAIAGRYPNNTYDNEDKSLGGLFLCYDLINKKITLNKTDSYAVWTTAFTKQGQMAAYSSNPITFLASPTKGIVFELMHYSFLTFSPDGQYFALSKKGYISKDSGRANWGHQQSTEVFICNINAPEDVICSYNDLSGNGIANLGKRKDNIASVAFSNDNRQLLMVGEDGVMIIRNLHLNGENIK